MVQPPRQWSLVHSLAGRDAGRNYLVVGFQEPNYVLVANGLNRSLQKPKRKNLRHLQMSMPEIPELNEKFGTNNTSNRDLTSIMSKISEEGITGRGREEIDNV